MNGFVDVHDCVPVAGLRKRLLARYYDKIMARYERFIAERKRTLFADLPNTVLEIGPGTGANLAYLPKGCRWIGVEPNPYMHGPLRQRAEQLGVEAEFRLATAEGIEMDDGSVDAVIATLVLCSVGDPDRVLEEVRRVLRPGGRFYFIEHIAAPRRTWLRTGQRLLRPAWMWIADGCRPDRETINQIEGAGFSSVAVDEFWMPREITPKFMARQVAGVAVKG